MYPLKKKIPNQNILYQFYKEGDLVRSCLPDHYSAGSANSFNTCLLGSCADFQNLLSRDKDSTCTEAKRAAGVCPKALAAPSDRNRRPVCLPSSGRQRRVHSHLACSTQQLRSGIFLSTHWFLLIKSNTFVCVCVFF